MPSNPVTGQLWIYNDILMYFDGSEWKPIKATALSDGQWPSSIFEDFKIVTPLHRDGDVVMNTNPDDYDYEGFNVLYPDNDKWQHQNYDLPEIDDPGEEVLRDPNAKSQYLIPNIRTDRVFLDENHDLSYEAQSSVCIQYPTPFVHDKVVSAVHINPGKITKMTKRLIKVDKENPTIYVSAYQTEFYGYRAGEYEGHFLIESNDQDYGDYIPVDDRIILNGHAAQNFDYVLSITYEFTWAKADGLLQRHLGAEATTSYYVTNLIEPINVHADGFKIEEAVYDVSVDAGTVTINDDAAANTEVQMWSPYKKQYGYIRETDLENNGIIHLHRKVSIPLVFVGGLLIHPLYGGLKFDGDRIIVPNPGELDTLKNMPWCVVDLYDPTIGIQYSERGKSVEEEAYWLCSEKDYLDGNGNFIMHGELSNTVDRDGFRDYILASGVLGGTNGCVIHYNNTKIGVDDKIMLFVDGLLVSTDEIVRNHAEGTLTLISGLSENQEYVLIRDDNGRLYDSSNMTPAFSVGLLSESLVYLNGKLLCNVNAVATTETPGTLELNGATHNEIKFFIPDDREPETGNWRIYNTYEFNWDTPSDKDIEDIKRIVSSYANLLTSLKINVPYDKYEDEVVIYAFRYANAKTALTLVGEATYLQDDEEDGKPVWITGSDTWSYGIGQLNLYHNGVKMIENIDYKEMLDDNKFKMLAKIEETDTISYIIEPLEHGAEICHQTIIMDQENAEQPNVYKTSEGAPDLYPGRLTVYVNGVRLKKDDWLLMDNRRILLRFTDYIAIGSADNYPTEKISTGNTVIEVNHNYPDYIMVEIRTDYDRRENSFNYKEDQCVEIGLEKYNVPSEILDSDDEVLIFVNGLFSGLTRNKRADYRFDKYNISIGLLNSDFVSMLEADPLKRLFERNSIVYAAWKKRTGLSEYEPDKDCTITLVWR